MEEENIEIKKKVNLSNSIDEIELDKLVAKFENRGIFLDLFDLIFPPNNPSIYYPSVKVTILYLLSFVNSL